jgi:ATP-dependent HslUV protease, peptidase subunit HslV
MELHRTLRDDYFLQTPSKTDGPFEPIGFHTLIANQYGIFGAFSSHSVIEYSRFYVIGRGSDYALGALEALYEKEKSSENLVHAALEIVSQFEIETWRREITEFLTGALCETCEKKAKQ